MTCDDIINIARNLNWEEMGADLWGAPHDGAMSIHALERFAALVVAKDHKACAIKFRSAAKQVRKQADAQLWDGGDRNDWLRALDRATSFEFAADALEQGWTA